MKDFLNFMILMRENPWSRITCCFCDKRKNPETYIIKFLSNQREVILKKRMLGKKNFWYHLKKNVRWSNYGRIRNIGFEAYHFITRQRKLVLIRNLVN
jgi:hypothetical protein